ncbi:MAG TPA: redoxin domain-containing protein [Planctomycetota bacterium]
MTQIQSLVAVGLAAALILSSAPAQDATIAKADQDAAKIASPASVFGKVKVGDTLDFLAEVTLKDSTGKDFEFKTWFKSKKEAPEKAPQLIALTFWSNSCPYQVAWNPDIVALAKKYQGQRVKFVAIDSNAGEQGQLDQINAIRSKTGLDFPVLMDAGNVVADMFGGKTTPHFYLIDRKGTVVYTGAPDNDPFDRMPAEEKKLYLDDAIKATLAGEKVAVPATKPVGCGIKKVSKADA